jgi:hypothetical protein
MVPTKDAMLDLTGELEVIKSEAEQYFTGSVKAMTDVGHNLRSISSLGPETWEALPEPWRQASDLLRKRIVTAGAQILELAKMSPLLGPADLTDIRFDLRRLTASLRFREFEHSAPYAITEEDRVYGMIPEEQGERPTHVNTAVGQFERAWNRLMEKISFIQPSKDDLPRAIVASEIPSIRKYRPNTAFIMMQIDKGNPRLEDVRVTIKDVFRSFGVEAVRSDEIEHQDVLTQRILDEIATSEFLIADLTGERPSVYYEVGFAHAVGKRPILYREKGTRLHFDLSVHNVPEYESITDLKNKLTKRLEALTNRSGAELPGATRS